MTDHLFVFGTLLSEYDHPMGRRLSSEAQLLGAAHCSGRIYLVQHYPGMVVSSDPDDRVFGELYRLPQSGELLRILDAYEGCGEDAAAPTEFVRALVTVTRADSAVLQAWAYLYNRPVAHLPLIASGRFLGH